MPPSIKDFCVVTQAKTPAYVKVVQAGIVALVGCSLSVGMAIAQSATLVEAEVYRLQNQVQLLPYQQQPRSATLADPLLPRDGVRTMSQSRAELLFNEGSLARIGANSLFRFVPGLRTYQLPDGSTRAEAVLQLEQGIALVMGPPGSIANRVQTPDAEIEVTPNAPDGGGSAPEDSTAVVIIYSPTLGTQVLNLTPNPADVSNSEGTETLTLQAGETLTVTNGELGPVQTFDLNRFHQTSGLAIGLGPGQGDRITDESARVQAILEQIRTETVAAANEQAEQLTGFCINDQAAVPTDNCITTNDDPLNTFEGERESITEPEPEIEPPVIEPPRTGPCPTSPPGSAPVTC